MFKNEILKFHRTLRSSYVHSKFCKPIVPISSQTRELGINFLIEWFANIFNSVDRDRLKAVGPDCACAEWLMMNGATVRFKGHPESISDYNVLMSLEDTPEVKQLKIEEVYAKEATVNSRGFDHFKNCKEIKKIIFIFCNRIDDSALKKLKYLQNSLTYLEIKSCFNVSDDGIKSLTQLRNLSNLNLAHLVSVKNPQDCEVVLKKELPNCKINFEKESP